MNTEIIVSRVSEKMLHYEYGIELNGYGKRVSYGILNISDRNGNFMSFDGSWISYSY